MTAAVMTLAVNMAMPAATFSGYGSTPKETMPETAKGRQTNAQATSTVGESGKDEEDSVRMASGNHGDKTVGFMGMTLNNEYHTTLANGAKVEAEAKRIKVEIQAGDQYASADVQLGTIGNMTASRVDGILLAPSPSNGLKSALTKCKEAGIPIINLDTKLTDEGLANVGLDTPFYGTNNYEDVKLAGEYVVKNLEKGTKTIILKGIEGQVNATDRYNGFIEGAGDMATVVAEQTASWEMDQGYTAARNIIGTNPDAEFFFYCNDNMGIGALRTIKGANIQGQIQTIRLNTVSGALNLVEDGESLATMAQCPTGMGKLGMGNILKTLGGGEAESYIDIGTEVVTGDSVGELRDCLKTFKQEQGRSFETDFPYGS